MRAVDLGNSHCLLIFAQTLLRHALFSGGTATLYQQQAQTEAESIINTLTIQ